MAAGTAGATLLLPPGHRGGAGPPVADAIPLPDSRSDNSHTPDLSAPPLEGRGASSRSTARTATGMAAAPTPPLTRRQRACGADSLADRALALRWQLLPKPTLRFAVTTAAPDSNVDGRSVPAVTALPLEGCWGDGLGGSASGRVTSPPTYLLFLGGEAAVGEVGWRCSFQLLFYGRCCLVS